MLGCPVGAVLHARPSDAVHSALGGVPPAPDAHHVQSPSLLYVWCRELQTPQTMAQGWPEQQDLPLQGETPLPEGSSAGGSRMATGAAAAAHADAVAAADRAMQELLVCPEVVVLQSRPTTPKCFILWRARVQPMCRGRVQVFKRCICVQAEEEAAEAPAQPSKAAAKRARKKAARQRAVAASSSAEQPGGTAAAQPADDANGSDQAPTSTCSSTPATSTVPLESAAELQATACTGPDTACATDLPSTYLTKDATTAMAESDWWRCPLSGRVMRDPVLCGGDGHSFEREALEQWLAASPGVDPLTRQPLPPGGGNIVPNHALRSLIQQLHLG